MRHLTKVFETRLVGSSSLNCPGKSDLQPAPCGTVTIRRSGRESSQATSDDGRHTNLIRDRARRPGRRRTAVCRWSTANFESWPRRNWLRREARPNAAGHVPWFMRPISGWSTPRRFKHWDSRGHFFAAAAEAMRRILVDAARRKGAAKNAGHENEQSWTWIRLPLQPRPPNCWHSTTRLRDFQPSIPCPPTWSNCGISRE